MKLITRPSTARMACAHAATSKTVYPFFLRKVMPATRRATVVARTPKGWTFPRILNHDAEVSVVSGVNSVLDRCEGGERPEENKEPQTTADDSKYTCCSRDTGAFRPGRVRGGLGRHAVSVWWGLGLPLLGWDGRLLRLPMGRRTLGVPAPGGVERGGRVAGDAGRSGSRGLAPSGVGGIDRS